MGKQAKSGAALERGALPWLLLVALATIAPHAGHLPLWLTALAGSLLVVRLWLWQGQRSLPPRWLLILLVVGGSAGIAAEFNTLLGRDAGVALLVLFMALKPMEVREQRDASVIVMLGYFLLLTHYFYSESIPTGLWLAAATTLLTATLIRLHGGPQPLARIARLGGLLLVQALPFMLILFLLFPRIAGPLWGLPQDAHAGQSGLSDHMAPGTLSNLIQSGDIAFRVQFTGVIPEKSERYWRGPVFEDYDGLNWRPGQRATSAEAPPSIEASDRRIAYTSTLEAHHQRWLLALDLPLILPPEAHLSATFETLAREPLHKRTRLAFTSAPDFRANIVEAQAVLASALRLPPRINPRTRALAAEWRVLPPEKIAASALALFRQEAFFYTLRPPLLGRHAMDEFLFDTRRGFCEHYASAFVFLMRAAGVPARVVTGYQGGEVNPVDGFLTVRQSDAHAWAEIWIAGRGWLRIDPTAAVAPSRIEQGIAAALPDDETLPIFARLDVDWLRTLRNRREAVNNTWNQWVLGYNAQRQKEVLERLGIAHPDWRSMAALLAILCSAALALVTLWTLYQRPRSDPAQRAWQRFCRRLDRLGVRRAVWEGPADFAARVTREHPAWASLTNQAAQHYIALRYRRGAPDTLKQLRRCTARLPYRWRQRP